MTAEYSQRIAKYTRRSACTRSQLGHLINYGARLCQWHAGGNRHDTSLLQSGSEHIFQLCRAWVLANEGSDSAGHRFATTLHPGKRRSFEMPDAVSDVCDLWITDPPYADAVNYEELPEFFLAWYKPHLQACFPDWYADSKRDHAVKGDDAAVPCGNGGMLHSPRRANAG